MRERWETSDNPVVHKIQEYVAALLFVVFVAILTIVKLTIPISVSQY